MAYYLLRHYTEQQPDKDRFVRVPSEVLPKFPDSSGGPDEAGGVIRNFPGLLRYPTVKFEDGRIATSTACETEKASLDMTAKAQELRGEPGSQLSKVLPDNPEVIQGEIVFALSK